MHMQLKKNLTLQVHSNFKIIVINNNWNLNFNFKKKKLKSEFELESPSPLHQQYKLDKSDLFISQNS